MPQPKVPTKQTHANHVAVLGGGLAGIAAAVQLADAGLAVTLIETRKRLGGRATSFVDPTTGQILDNCQHVLLGCCTNLLNLYQRLGVAQHIRWYRKLNFVDDLGRIDTLEADDLPAPLHLTTSLMSFKSITVVEKVAIARAMFVLMRLGRRGRGQWHDRSFAHWLKTVRQPSGAVSKFWAPIIISACNELPERLAADYAMQVFQDGFLSHEDAYVMGVPAVPLVELYATAEAVIEKAGGTICLSTVAGSLQFAGGRVTAVTIDADRRFTADAFISALPFDRLAKICSPQMRGADPRLEHLDAFNVSPIIGIHLWLDRPVMDLPHLILTKSPLQWIFNKGLVTCPSTGQHLHAVISAAHDLVNQPSDGIVAMALDELRKVLPTATDACLLHSRVVKEKRATFSARPGIATHRPLATGPIENLYLAGDWACTGWPATMEGAVRSGYLAAAGVLQNLNRPVQPLVDDLSPTSLYQLFTP